MALGIASTTRSIDTRTILIGMVLVFLIVHTGFGITYFQYFPDFQQFTYIHHIHGALMGAWVMLLVAQPFLVHYKKLSIHRVLGKMSWLLAPAIIISMILVARLNYQAGIKVNSSIEVFAKQSITWTQILLFVLFYGLAMVYRKQTFQHLRFIVGTAILMLGPPLGRIILNCWGPFSIPYFAILPLVIKTLIAALLWTLDIYRKRDGRPNFIVLLAFLFADLVYYFRFSEAWQAFGRLVINILY